MPALPPQSAFQVGQRHDSFTWMGEQFLRILGDKIKNDGNGYQPGPGFSEYDAANVRLVQQYGLGETPDGWFGPNGWAKLATMGYIGDKIGSTQTPPPPPPPSGNPPLPPQSAFAVGQRHDSFTWMGQQFIRILGNKIKSDGNGYQPGPGFSEYDAQNVRLVQQYGFNDTPDGWFGSRQWDALDDLGNISDKIPASGTTPPPPPSGGTGGGVTTPIEGGRITTPYGARGKYWSLGRDANGNGIHTGDDWACSLGQTVRTTWSGKVVRVTRGDVSYGNFVIVEATINGERRWLYFCHLNTIDVALNQLVKSGQRVGGAGATGNATGVHLHHEQRRGGMGFNTNDIVKPIY